jgi:hypothetical protein
MNKLHHSHIPIIAFLSQKKELLKTNFLLTALGLRLKKFFNSSDFYIKKI